ncbi:MAD2L1-binding protein [Gouania willdenowi]|uniref:MAD2L1-binding protein n=1 Tax=Gouania willdenowi TaxID=441366 RepID=A0A8C5I3I0_GOUWI|nr:MAD2L1-binding protein [Gouania willdenowi]
MFAGNNDRTGLRMRLSFSSEGGLTTSEQQNEAHKALGLQSVAGDSDSQRLPVETTEEMDERAGRARVNTDTTVTLKDTTQNQEDQVVKDKENAQIICQDTLLEEHSSGPDNCQDFIATGSKHVMEERDAEVWRKAQEEGCVKVVFPGVVTQEGCCRFVSEILKCILYQRQQLPMTYDQLVYSQKKQASTQDKDSVRRRPVPSVDRNWRKSQQTLQELEEVLQQLEVLFSLSKVPRVLLSLGGSLILPKELYEINMEDLLLSGGDQCLRVSSCLRQLFRTLFVADILSDTKAVRLMPTTVLALAHRDCGVSWFRPKLLFKVPTRVKKQTIALSSDPCISGGATVEGSEWQDYVWFQAPIHIKGFSN